VQDKDQFKELVQLTFKTEPGAKLLEELVETYVRPNIYQRQDTHDTAYRLGAESVVKLIMELLREDNDDR